MPDHRDRRCQKVCLTKKGKSLEPTLGCIVTDFQEKSLSGLTQRDLDSMARILRQIIENVSRDLKSSEVSDSLPHVREVHPARSGKTRKHVDYVARDKEIHRSYQGA